MKWRFGLSPSEGRILGSIGRDFGSDGRDYRFCVKIFSALMAVTVGSVGPSRRLKRP